MESFLVEQFAARLGRILNTKFTVGVGTTEPTGILTAATAGPTALGSAANTGGTETGGTSIGYIDLVELEHSVDPLYRRGAKFILNDSTLRKIKEILDKYGRPLWVPGVAAGAPDTILGYPYSINNDMPTIAVNAKTVLFGAVDRYMIRRVKQLQVLRLVERFADYGQVAFLGFARYDGNLLDAGTHPVKYLVQAAS
jgi:HK97 family phage major capsid protein